MRYQLWLSDGVRVVSLTDGNPVAGTTSYVPVTGDGSGSPLRERCGFLVEGRANARTVAGLLNQLFQRARDRDRTKAGHRVYVYLQVEGDADAWRSEVSDGRVLWDEQTLDTMMAGDLFEVEAEWTRVGAWDGAVQGVVATNNGGSGGTVGIYNHDDYTGLSGSAGTWLGPLGLTSSEGSLVDTDGHDNWVQIAGDAVTGDLPALTSIEVANQYSAAATTIYIGHFVDGTGEHLSFEAEDAFGSGTALPVTADPTLYSNGKYKRVLPGSANAEVELMGWNLPSSLLLAAEGRAFRVMVRLAAPYAGAARLFMRVQLNSTNVLYQTQKVRMGGADTLIDLGVLVLPTLPHSENPAALAGVALELVAQSTSGGNLDVDFVQLLPAESFRRLEPIAAALNDGDRLVDDGMAGALYRIVSGAEVANYIGYGDQIRLVPGVTQTLYFLIKSVGGASEVMRDSNITVKYRPRRNTL